MNHPGWVVTKYPRFCALHFDKNDIIDGKNNKLQYSAVPVYFGENIRDEHAETINTAGPNAKISSLLSEMQHNQLLYSSDSECEYQITVKVTKKPRNTTKDVGDSSGNQAVLRCVHCHKNKKNAVEMQAHLRTIHNVIVDIITPKSASIQIRDDEIKNYMCSICGLVFKNDPENALIHMDVTHKTIDQVQEETIEDVMMEEEEEADDEEEFKQIDDYEEGIAEYIDPMQVDVKDDQYKTEYILAEGEEAFITVVPKQEILKEEVITIATEEDLIEENVQTTYKCRVCNSDFVDKDEVKQHISQMHTVSKLNQQTKYSSSEEEKEAYDPVCYICDLQCITLAKMRKHMKRIHNTEEYYYCQHCTGTFLSLDMYEDHECLDQLT